MKAYDNDSLPIWVRQAEAGHNQQNNGQFQSLQFHIEKTQRDTHTHTQYQVDQCMHRSSSSSAELSYI